MQFWRLLRTNKEGAYIRLMDKLMMFSLNDSFKITDLKD